MKYCSHCGKEANDDAKFCEACGTAFSDDRQTAPDDGFTEEKQTGEKQTSSSLIAMVTGILSLFFFRIPLGIIAIVMANKSRQEEGNGQLTDQAKAGMICGVIGIALSAVGAVYRILVWRAVITTLPGFLDRFLNLYQF